MPTLGVGELIIIGSILCFWTGILGVVVWGVWFLMSKNRKRREDS